MIRPCSRQQADTRRTHEREAKRNTPHEADDFLEHEKTCRVATIDVAGNPHVTPLWFVRDGPCVWLNSISTQATVDPSAAWRLHCARGRRR
ncbi:pyridoxamine 5'-phosphate oxidase family protein [Rhodococcus aetherivorans]|uniref:pyridoxamine 5'-phosphate oxidase family protein n=1 Tax=Rhodococcus aetherivorans TaxID=191292 RepID=UPI003BF9D61E